MSGYEKTLMMVLEGCLFVLVCWAACEIARAVSKMRRKRRIRNAR